ncbi:PH domain-containing protein [Paraglaciecola arctica]|uniref:PH domain-containing protein n=1 Tax=Paraglaciecola arctica TaxID=1128911 RepID=UPI001C0725DB|nr:PH domain-containing protein [Paraglaciecola arctica]MBU3003760.1 PH domain-containing protein [Paraglaciecola arctica]
MENNCIAQATFNPKVRNYWTVIWVFISFITVAGILLSPLVAMIAWLVSKKILNAMSATLLERKLVVKRGIIFVVEKSIPLEKITDIALSQGPVMRFFGLYQLSFETAGQSSEGALVSLIGINDAKAFRETILKQKDRLTGNQSIEIEKPEAATNDLATNDLHALTESVQNIEKILKKLLDDKHSDN